LFKLLIIKRATYRKIVYTEQDIPLGLKRSLRFRIVAKSIFAFFRKMLRKNTKKRLPGFYKNEEMFNNMKKIAEICA
jgi:hypothetical protein